VTFNLGISIYSIPGISIDTLFEFAEEHHFNTVELWDSPLPTMGKSYRKLIDNFELSVHAPLINIGVLDAIKLNIQVLRESIYRSSRWGANRLILHTGQVKMEDRAIALNSAKNVIDENLTLLKKCELILCIENVSYPNAELIRDFKELALFVDSFPKDLVGVAFDVSHANIKEGVNDGIDILRNRIKEIHLSDNNGNIENHHLPLGKGNIDFNILKNGLNLKDIVAILEIKPDENWKKNLLDSQKFLQELKVIN
jgi:sugar phosphate isomerase/epimerase